MHGICCLWYCSPWTQHTNLVDPGKPEIPGGLYSQAQRLTATRRNALVDETMCCDIQTPYHVFCHNRHPDISEILILTEADKQAILTMASQMAGAGLRVIAFAEKPLPDGRPTQAEAESGLTFIGLAGLADPPRPEARDAIAACHTAGIRPLMITGDHPLTARAIAQHIGLSTDGRVLTGPELDTLSDEALRDVAEQVSLYARTTPEHKLRLVKTLQASGERVAVTGDGINDAPALAAADIGVAMGEKGTDVAREAAAMVLADDNFATIVHPSKRDVSCSRICRKEYATISHARWPWSR
jgi:magnesium-transporting ATPase (P-type)